MHLLLDLLYSVLFICTVIGGHKLCVPAREEDATWNVSQQGFQKSPHLVNGAVVKFYLVSCKKIFINFTQDFFFFFYLI